jgi:hypothetical protein
VNQPLELLCLSAHFFLSRRTAGPVSTSTTPPPPCRKAR